MLSQSHYNILFIFSKLPNLALLAFLETVTNQMNLNTNLDMQEITEL